MAVGILDWSAESVNVIIFAQSATAPITALFEEAFGVAPASSNENVSPQTGRVGTASSEPINMIAKTISSHPGRVELLMHGAGDGPDGYPAKILDPRSAIEELVEAARRIAGRLSGIVRIAVHCRVARHFEQVEQANAEIAKAIPFTYKMNSKRDFIFQINEPTEVQGVKLNRVVKWSVESMQMITGGSPFPMLNVGMPLTVRDFWGAIVHLDFNTIIPRPTFFTEEEAKLALSAACGELLKVRKNDLRFS
ncbi:hypothetical protein ACU8OP_10205 [Rhizobium leguminosarum]